MGTVITVNSDTKTFREFQSLKCKEYFIYESELYIKLSNLNDTDDDFNALCINDGALAQIDDDEKIIAVSKVDISYTI